VKHCAGRIGFAAALALAIPLIPGCGERRQHVVLISVDTLRLDHLTPYGYDRNTSPNVDALARGGVLFEETIAAHTNTAPSHASIMTGLHPPSHGIVRNRYRLNAETQTLAQILKEQDFATAAFVSGYTLRKEHTSLDRGFPVYDDRVAFKVPADETFGRAAEWLEAQAPMEQPVFLFFHLFDPHFPYDAPDPFAGRFLPGGGEGYRFDHREALERVRSGAAAGEEAQELIVRYDDEIAYADHYVGRLVETLKALGYWDEALVIFVSDHGETLTERVHPFDHGGRAYEEQIRVPLILRFPGNRFEGRRIATPAHHVDIMPTVLDWLGLAVPEDVEGRSLMPWIDPPWLRPPPSDAARELVSFARPAPQRTPEVRGAQVPEGLIAALRGPRWKLISYPTRKGFAYQLFDLVEDPGERTNLIDAKPGLAGAMAARLQQWREWTGAAAPRKVPKLSPDSEKALEALGYVR
jgi:arylsulfatase A-like enzyme